MLEPKLLSLDRDHSAEAVLQYFKSRGDWSSSSCRPVSACMGTQLVATHSDIQQELSRGASFGAPHSPIITLDAIVLMYTSARILILFVRCSWV